MANSASLKYLEMTPSSIGDQLRFHHDFVRGWIWGSIALIAWWLLWNMVIWKHSCCLSRSRGDTNFRMHSHWSRLVSISFGCPKVLLITLKCWCSSVSLTSTSQNWGYTMLRSFIIWLGGNCCSNSIVIFSATTACKYQIKNKYTNKVPPSKFLVKQPAQILNLHAQAKLATIQMKHNF